MEKHQSLIFYCDDLYLSPYTFSVQCALLEKKIPFQLKEVHFEKSRSKDQAFKNASLTELIPAIDDGGFVLSESLAILEYLEEKFTGPIHPSLLPKTIKNRAKARMLLSWYRCGMKALRAERSTETVFYPSLRTQHSLSSDAQDEVNELTFALKEILSHQEPFLFENQWSIVDAETALMLQRLALNGDPLDSELLNYTRSHWTRPTVSAFVNQKRRVFASYY